MCLKCILNTSPIDWFFFFSPRLYPLSDISIKLFALLSWLLIGWLQLLLRYIVAHLVINQTNVYLFDSGVIWTCIYWFLVIFILYLTLNNSTGWLIINSLNLDSRTPKTLLDIKKAQERTHTHTHKKQTVYLTIVTLSQYHM